MPNNKSPWHQLAREDAKSGMTNRQIAEKYGVKRKTIANILVGAELPKGRRDKVTFPESSPRMIKKSDQDMKIVEMRSQGLAPQSIAVILGLKSRTVQKICQRLGIASTPGVNHSSYPRKPRSKSQHMLESPKPTFTDQQLKLMYAKARISSAMATYERFNPSKKVTLPRLSILETEL